MSLIYISEHSFPTYVALSSDISASKISGASLIGKTVYTHDDQSWYIISGSELLLEPFSYPLPKHVSSETASFGISPDYTAFEADGTMVLSGSATVWDDIFFPLVTAKQGQTDKPAFSTTEIAYLFPENDTAEFMYIIAQIPHTYMIGSDLSPHVHWKQTQSGSVTFKMDYKWFPISGSVPASFETHIMNTPAVTYTSGSMHQLTYGTKISGSMLQTTSVGVSSMMLIKLYRDDNGTYPGNAVVYQFDLHYLKNSLGSRTEFVK